MSTQQNEPYKDRTVGTRLRAEVEEAHRVLDASAAGPDRQTQLSRGILTGYLWALGRGEDAPITGARTEGPPDIPMLTAEVDAATVQLEDTTQRTIPRDYIRGVHDALAWVCGHSDQRP